jgi:hypothetical protein
MDQPIARPLCLHRTTQRMKMQAYIHASSGIRNHASRLRAVRDHARIKPCGHFPSKHLQLTIHSNPITWPCLVYEGAPRSFRTGSLERELQMVEPFATRCSFIAILWVSLVCFTAITLCVAFQWEFIFISLSTQSQKFWVHVRMSYQVETTPITKYRYKI